jgi:uncharacterized HAD superfamily protein
MANKFKIGIDVDGVIFDYMVTVRAYAELYDYSELHKNGLVDKVAMKVGKRYDWTKKELKKFADRYFVELSKSTPFNPLAIKIIKKLIEEGHELFTISNRGLIHKEAITVIEQRFKDNGLKFNNLFWKVSDKTKVLLENKIDIIIDDSPDICEDAVAHGLAALYFREKNSRKIIESSKLHDVDNWGQIYRHIKEIEKEDGR